MDKKICPLCGNLMDEQDDTLFCPQCNDSAKKRDEIVFFEEDEVNPGLTPCEDEEETEEDVIEDIEEDPNEIEGKKKPNKKLFFILSVLVVLIIATIIFLFIYDKKEKERATIEMALWFSCIEENTPQSYSKYLFEYPKGKFSVEAQQKITELRNLETQDWDNLRKSVNLEDYFSFINKYPNTPYKNAIRHIMDSLSWVVAERGDTQDSYLVYLENYRLGNIAGYYSAVAQKRYDYLKTIKKVEGEELLKVKDGISHYFKALSNQDYDKLSGILTSTVNNFYGERNFSSSKIIKAIQSDISRNSIKTLVYTPVLENIVVQKDSTGLYFTDIKVEKKIISTKKKTPESINELLRIELTPGIYVRSIFLSPLKELE